MPDDEPKPRKTLPFGAAPFGGAQNPPPPPPPKKKPFFVFLAFPLNNITYYYFTNKVVTKLRTFKDKGCTLYDVYILLFCLKGTRLL